MNADIVPSADPTERRLTLRRDGIYEVQSLWVQPESDAAFEAWLGDRIAIEQQYGASDLIVVEPLKALYGEYLPTVVRLLAWPSNDSFDDLRHDPKAVELDELLDQSVSEATITQMRLHPDIHASPDEFEVKLDTRVCYELCTFWDRPNVGRELWDAFIAAATPSIEAHGGHPLWVFQPLEAIRGDFLPTRFCVAAWDTLEDFESFVNAPEQEEISSLRWRAVSRMDATGGRLR